MKTACLLFLAISGALMCGTGNAVASNPASQQTSSESSANTTGERPREHIAPAVDTKHQTGGTLSGEQKDHRGASNANHARSHARVANANRPKQFPNSRERLTVGNPRNLRQPGPNKSVTVAKNGLIQHKTVSSALAVRPPRVFRSSSFSQDNVRHRGPNPAVIAGSANSRTGNTGMINGTRMNRRP